MAVRVDPRLHFIIVDGDLGVTPVVRVPSHDVRIIPR
jgi:hypothetical protein